MKKILTISLSLLILLSAFCGCNSTPSTTDEDAMLPTSTQPDSTEGAVEIYLNNADLWEANNTNTWFGYMFIDLDFDGTLELVSSSKAENSDSYTNRFFRLDKENKTVKEIPCNDKDAVNLWDFQGGDYPQLYKNNATGELKYMVYDNYREEMTVGGMRIGEMTYSEADSIKTKNLWGFSYASADGALEGNFTFTYTSFDEDNNAKEISSDEYNKVLEDYENNNTNLNLTFKFIEQTTEEYTYTSLTKEEKLALFTEAYKAFGYSK